MSAVRAHRATHRFAANSQTIRVERRSVEKVEVRAARFHGVDQELVATVKAEHHDLEEAASRVESKAQLTGRSVLVEVADEDGMQGGVDGVIRVNSVLMRGVVDLHVT